MRTGKVIIARALATHDTPLASRRYRPTLVQLGARPLQHRGEIVSETMRVTGSAPGQIVSVADSESSIETLRRVAREA